MNKNVQIVSFVSAYAHGGVILIGTAVLATVKIIDMRRIVLLAALCGLLCLWRKLRTDILLILPLAILAYFLIGKLLDGLSISSWVSQIREFIGAKIASSFPLGEGQLMQGILIGDTSQMPKYIYKDFSTAGITHIMAVSGFNMNVVYSLARKTLGFLPNIFRDISSLAMLSAYLVIVGLDNFPAMRAYFIQIFAFGARISGHRPNQVHLLILATFVMTAMNQKVLESVGFQLSIMASLGMIASGQVLTKPICNLKESIFATIFTLPVTIYYFGSINLFGIITNIFVLPLIGPLTYLGMVYVVSPLTLVIATWLPAQLSHIIVFMASYFAKINPVQVIIAKNNTALCAGIIILLLVLMYKLSQRQNLK